jgi:hypothetical protein
LIHGADVTTNCGSASASSTSSSHCSSAGRRSATTHDDRSPRSKTPLRNDQPSAGVSLDSAGAMATKLGGAADAASHWVIPTYDMPAITTRPSHHG